MPVMTDLTGDSGAVLWAGPALASLLLLVVVLLIRPIRGAVQEHAR